MGKLFKAADLAGRRVRIVSRSDATSYFTHVYDLLPGGEIGEEIGNVAKVDITLKGDKTNTARLTLFSDEVVFDSEQRCFGLKRETVETPEPELDLYAVIKNE